MANLYKKPVVLTDPKTGVRSKTKSKKWWGQYKDATGRLRRQPLAVDKAAAQAMLNEIVRNVEREKAGLIDPTDTQRKRPLADHISEFETYLVNKGVTAKQVYTVITQLRKMAEACQWHMIAQVNSSSLLKYLGDLRQQGRSAQTYNHYLKAAKQFTNWLVRDQRTPYNMLAHVTRLNVATDRRHDRRALSAEELQRLMDAAREGKRIEGISGPDRAIIYALAAWTGFRKGEIGSLTRASLELDSDPPVATV
ncbi:MAG: tyrosine-type recombinase/integrase, partial [Planctomycetota bacterium]